VLEKIIEGKLTSFYTQFVLMDQAFIRDDKLTIAQLIAETTAKTGENITIGRFTRYRVGEVTD
jgi:elongation factor Ts